MFFQLPDNFPDDGFNVGIRFDDIVVFPEIVVGKGRYFLGHLVLEFDASIPFDDRWFGLVVRNGDFRQDGIMVSEQRTFPACLELDFHLGIVIIPFTFRKLVVDPY